jgi:flagellar biosynthesis/type III secretory pathway M-ring protein FliF/YscJ
VTLWLLLKAAGGWLGGILRAVPWQVWAGIAVALALWWAVNAIDQRGYERGVADTTAEQAKAVAEAQAAQKAAEKERDRIAKDIAETTQAQAEAATADIRNTATAASERVVTVMRTVEVPIGCPVELPPAVADELNAAVERANRR